MKFNKHYINVLIILVVLPLLLQACTPSMVYSPSINLPGRPMSSNDGQIIYGFTKLAETNPIKINKKTSSGREFLVRYAISNRTAIQIKGWMDFSGNPKTDYRSGLSVGSIINLYNSKKM